MNKLNTNKVLKIYELFNSGVFIIDICSLLNVSKDTVKRYLISKYGAEEVRKKVIDNKRVCYIGRIRPTDGREITNSGYVRLYIGMENGKPIHKSEHRIIMEEHLGRRLNKDEVVHHINGDKLDNRLGNLELMTVGNHRAMHNRMSVHRMLRDKATGRIIKWQQA